MRKFYGLLAAACVVLLTLSVNNSYGQSTYSKVYQILSQNCQGTGCHEGGPGNAQAGLDFSLSDTAVYAEIIGKVPVNPAAAAKGNFVIDSGYPERSFLLRKIANCAEPTLALDPAEGAVMPNNRPALADSLMEIIRQWIIQAAPDTGNVVNIPLIEQFYSQSGPPQRILPPAPPEPCQGYQIHMGPLFHAPGQQDEYFKRYDLRNPDSVEIRGMNLTMTPESHHFILRKYNPGTATQYPTSLVPLTLNGFLFDNNKNYVMAWQTDKDIPLPNGTAYKWEPRTSLDLDYHVDNFDTVIIGADVYLNVYTQPSGTARIEMQSTLINEFIAGITPDTGIYVADTNVRNYTGVFTDLNASIWSITPHTHKYGVFYDVWLENPDHSNGDMVFNGYYNFDYTAIQGFYSWQHPPTNFMEPMLYMGDPGSNGQTPLGLNETAKYYNYGDSTVNFGFTTADEMMIIYIQYVNGRYNIPAQGYNNPNCVLLPYANPCNVTTDTDKLHVGDIIIGQNGNTGRNNNTTLSNFTTDTVSLGDTVTITTNGQTIIFIVTGSGTGAHDTIGPFIIQTNDYITFSANGLLYDNGQPIGQVTSVVSGITSVNNVPEVFSVFPNPFEGHTNIQYGLAENATVSLDIYDILGRRLDVLADNETQNAGAHSYTYTPSANSNGIYFVKMTINGVTTVKKISLL